TGAIEKPRRVISLLRRRRIGKPRWHDAEHLDPDAIRVAVAQPRGRVPAVALDLTKEGPVGAEHARAAFVDALHLDELRPPARKLGRNHVRVDVNASHAGGRTSCKSCSPDCP